jgi:hypothetical protein
MNWNFFLHFYLLVAMVQFQVNYQFMYRVVLYSIVEVCKNQIKFAFLQYVRINWFELIS